MMQYMATQSTMTTGRRGHAAAVGCIALLLLLLAVNVAAVEPDVHPSCRQWAEQGECVKVCISFFPSSLVFSGGHASFHFSSRAGFISLWLLLLCFPVLSFCCATSVDA
jgi:hypothetical protein